MVDLHALPKIVGKRKKRLGRGVGSGSGAKSGRGTTRHQKARTNIAIHFEGGQNKITKKYPLLRGKGRNKSIKDKPFVINLDRLNAFKANDTVSIDSLVEARMVSDDAYQRGVKILGRGEIEKALKVALPVSENAKEKIEKAGGTLITA